LPFGRRPQAPALPGSREVLGGPLLCGERLTQRGDGVENIGLFTPIEVEVACFAGPVKTYLLCTKTVAESLEVTVWGGFGGLSVESFDASDDCVPALTGAVAPGPWMAAEWDVFCRNGLFVPRKLVLDIEDPPARKTRTQTRSLTGSATTRSWL